MRTSYGSLERGQADGVAVRVRADDNAGMKVTLLQSNAWLRGNPQHAAALYRSAASSSAVEGIVRPFAKADRAVLSVPRKDAKSARSRG